ncbi:putative cysteine desulfurase family protein [Gordonia araii NBRC 100433]|uniref:Putative cysteine desulfurase family protein n=1 Tax=Gordonia araii NBRC 100433 TaxID=1073574 RepID=G7H1T3_9ACTN|nr:aminotransferase class V-fold PLP-dependent enzyme [Gordonia araii]NNG97143.1 aminotransferase class V-fold PLP-dependent enzyme [Gordonia araii NBRC 100433]GAB09808.1 putative cysteine desulfurase family protein [Gordonia araii NBRC 100433]
MPFDVAHARGLFPVLGDGWIRLDPQAGMLIPASVAMAVSSGFRELVTDPGTSNPGARATGDALASARRAIADLVKGDPAGVVIGPSVAHLVSGLADAFDGHSWWGTEVLLSRDSDPANTVPWERRAGTAGARTRWAESDIETGTIPIEQYMTAIGDATKVVALPLASSTSGAIADVAEVAAKTRAAGALLVVDASAAAPYLPLDITESGADVFLVSAHRWGGPRLAAMVFADPRRIDRLEPIALDRSASGPARLELVPPAGGLLAGLVASVEHLANLDDDAVGKRRHRLASSMDGLYEYLQRLDYYMMNSLESLSAVRVFGRSEHRVPITSFMVSGVPAEHVVRRLADNGIRSLANVPSPALEQLGVNDEGGAVTIGLGPYSTPYEVDHLVRTLGSLA